MSVEPEQYIADIVCAAGGRLVSRIRLQKIAYLLDQLGAASGFDYTYHHYGPFSRDIDSAVMDAEAFDLIQEKFERRQRDGARYSIFEAKGDVATHTYDALPDARLRDLCRRWAGVPATVLELAATAHWLVQYEHVGDWQDEIVRRKGAKTEKGRLEKALELLKEVGLRPGAEPA